ncbi:MAG: hypothetical protein R3E34_09060 [Rhodocyclaceae bacterium]
MPIKDVRTSSAPCARYAPRLPEAVGWIAGPLDEDPSYVAECRNLIDSLGRKGDAVRLLGMQRASTRCCRRCAWWCSSSISEALPLVARSLRRLACCVSTDVGACRELIEGQDAADRAPSAPLAQWSALPIRKPWPTPRSTCWPARPLARLHQRGRCAARRSALR